MFLHLQMELEFQIEPGLEPGLELHMNLQPIARHSISPAGAALSVPAEDMI